MSYLRKENGRTGWCLGVDGRCGQSGVEAGDKPCLERGAWCREGAYIARGGMSSPDMVLCYIYIKYFM